MSNANFCPHAILYTRAITRTITHTHIHTRFTIQNIILHHRPSQNLPLMRPLRPTLILHPNPRIIRRLRMFLLRLLRRTRRIRLRSRRILTTTCPRPIQKNTVSIYAP